VLISIARPLTVRENSLGFPVFILQLKEDVLLARSLISSPLKTSMSCMRSMGNFRSYNSLNISTTSLLILIGQPARLCVCVDRIPIRKCYIDKSSLKGIGQPGRQGILTHDSLYWLAEYHYLIFKRSGRRRMIGSTHRFCQKKI